MRILNCIVLSLLIATGTFAQRVTGYSRSELGVFVGGSYYIGDLNPYKHFTYSHPAGGLIFRYNIHSRLALRFNALYGNVRANDKNSKIELYKNRNLNFKSSFFEFAGGVEFNYFPFQVGHPRYKGTAYLLAQIGFFQMNPKATVNDKDELLRPLGTEGQGSSLSSKNRYSLTQLCMPLGLGARLTLWKIGTLNLEFGIRKTFTDYLDDVHSDTFVDAAVLSKQNGTLAGKMSNLSLDGNPYGRRGNSVTKDWYVFYGFMLTFKLGSHSSCPSAL
jgi:hypothetical protein